MRQFNYAKNIVLATDFVRDGKIKVFPQSIINDLDEFNEKFETEFAYDSYSRDIMEYLRKTYNNHTISDYSNLKHKTKEWFNNRFYPYAYVIYRR